jgi:ring-1,2-phenylacetyl-CoA epoxidase subunit PaaE
MTNPVFHDLSVTDVSAETNDAITLQFDVPAHLRDAYRFTQGQFLTLNAVIDGEPLRRSYSICTSVPDYERNGELRVGIKRVNGGRFSNWANESIRIGQSLEVMTPQGRFFTDLAATNTKHYVGFAGGSGITPMLSLIATSLETEPHSKFTLVYGNRTVNSIMFLEALEALKNRFIGRFRLIHVLSDEPQDMPLFNGLLDQNKCAEVIEHLLSIDHIDQAFICGPEVMMNAAEAALIDAGLSEEQIAVERFGTPNPSGAPVNTATTLNETNSAAVTIVMDGKSRQLRVPYEGAAILDAGLQNGANLPYACKGGVCCTCRARVLKGSVSMDKNYTLEQWEMDQGFVLTCQSHPTSEEVVVSFDER